MPEYTVKYEIWPPRPIGGQQVGPGPQGVRGVAYIGYYPAGVEAFCERHRSQFKNRSAVAEMIEWCMANAR